MKKVVVLISVMFVSGCWLNHKEPAEANAKVYAEQMMPGYKAIQCTNLDTDKDSYVSCTVKDSSGELVPLECVGAIPPWVIIRNTGCRIPQLRGKMQ